MRRWPSPSRGRQVHTDLVSEPAPLTDARGSGIRQRCDGQGEFTFPSGGLSGFKSGIPSVTIDGSELLRAGVRFSSPDRCSIFQAGN